MKHLFSLVIVLNGAWFSTQAQLIQNPSFENWTFTDTLWNGEPIYEADQWQGGNRTNDSYSGNYAATVEPMLACGIMSGFMIYGGFDLNHFNYWAEDPDFTGSGAAVNFKPASITGFFKFPSPESTDIAKGFVILKKFNSQLGISEEVGRGELEFNPTTEYTPFTIVVNDFQPGVMPDSIVICFSSGMGYAWDAVSENPQLGVLYIDQLRVEENIAGINELVQMHTSFFPNPATQLLNYSFETTVTDVFSIVLLDATGKTVYSESTHAGTQHSIDLNHLASGTYHAQIRGMNRIYANETIVVKE